MTLHTFSAVFVLLLSTAAVVDGQARKVEGKLPGQVISVEAGEFFLRAPDTISSGLTTFVLRQVGDMLTNRKKVLAENLAPAAPGNDPTRAFHMLWVVRLDSGHTVSEWYEAEIKGEKISWATHLGGPSMADPPMTSNATMLLRPGNYALVCHVGSAREDKSRSHLMKGMFRPLTVLASSAAVQALPDGDVSAVISGTGQVKLNGTLRKGMQSIRVTNTTEKAYEFTVHKVKRGRTATEAVTWRRTDGTDHPFGASGGFSDVPPGESRITTIAFTPGTYVLWTVRSPRTSVTVTIPAS